MYVRSRVEGLWYRKGLHIFSFYVNQVATLRFRVRRRCRTGEGRQSGACKLWVQGLGCRPRHRRSSHTLCSPTPLAAVYSEAPEHDTHIVYTLELN